MNAQSEYVQRSRMRLRHLTHFNEWKRVQFQFLSTTKTTLSTLYFPTINGKQVQIIHEY